jgi:hypothetical protein
LTVQTLQDQLSQRPPFEQVQRLQQEFKNLELILQGTQRENEKCMADLERQKLREKTLERELTRLAGDNWQVKSFPPCFESVRVFCSQFLLMIRPIYKSHLRNRRLRTPTGTRTIARIRSAQSRVWHPLPLPSRSAVRALRAPRPRLTKNRFHKVSRAHFLMRRCRKFRIRRRDIGKRRSHILNGCGC